MSQKLAKVVVFVDVEFLNISENFFAWFLRRYVHCVAGVSRSSTITLAYIMPWLGLDFESAFAFLRSRREFASPNFGFEIQLKDFHEENESQALSSELKSLLPFSKSEELRHNDEKVVIVSTLSPITISNTLNFEVIRVEKAHADEPKQEFPDALVEMW